MNDDLKPGDFVMYSFDDHIVGVVMAVDERFTDVLKVSWLDGFRTNTRRSSLVRTSSDVYVAACFS